MEFAELDLGKIYSYADYYTWNIAERVELIEGKVYKALPAPYRVHQEICVIIVGELYQFLKNKPCSVFTAPFDVRLPKLSSEDSGIFNVFQPDVCVVCDPKKLDKRGCIGAPDIVVEVLSPGNNAKELKYKFDVYEQSGVKEYWLVFPAEQVVMVYFLMNGKFSLSKLFPTGAVLTSEILPGFALDITQLFESNNDEE